MPEPYKNCFLPGLHYAIFDYFKFEWLMKDDYRFGAFSKHRQMARTFSSEEEAKTHMLELIALCNQDADYGALEGRMLSVINFYYVEEDPKRPKKPEQKPFYHCY